MEETDYSEDAGLLLLEIWKWS